jgi:hypothetical protein
VWRNRITIEGSTELAFSEDVAQRFAGLAWSVQHVKDANDTAAIERAFEAFQAETGRPTIDWDADLPEFPADAKGWRGGTPATRCSTRWRSGCHPNGITP